MNEQQLQDKVRALFTADELKSRTAPSFRSTLEFARQRLTPQANLQPREHRLGWVLTVGCIAAVAVLGLLVTRTPNPSLQDDIRLAQSLDFDSVWRSPSDRLLAQSTPGMLRDIPAMPRRGEPQFDSVISPAISKEYL